MSAISDGTEVTEDSPLKSFKFQQKVLPFFVLMIIINVKC